MQQQQQPSSSGYGQPGHTEGGWLGMQPNYPPPPPPPRDLYGPPPEQLRHQQPLHRPFQSSMPSRGEPPPPPPQDPTLNAPSMHNRWYKGVDTMQPPSSASSQQQQQASQSGGGSSSRLPTNGPGTFLHFESPSRNVRSQPPHPMPEQMPPPGMDNGGPMGPSSWGPPPGSDYPPPPPPPESSQNSRQQQQQQQQQPPANRNWLHYGPQGERARDPSDGPSAGKFFKGGQPTPGDDWLNGQVKPTHGRLTPPPPPGYGPGQTGNGR